MGNNSYAIWVDLMQASCINHFSYVIKSMFSFHSSHLSAEHTIYMVKWLHNLLPVDETVLFTTSQTDGHTYPWCLFLCLLVWFLHLFELTHLSDCLILHIMCVRKWVWKSSQVIILIKYISDVSNVLLKTYVQYIPNSSIRNACTYMY